jgi:dihydrofolate synthase / folylpolyglutamate synthase
VTPAQARAWIAGREILGMRFGTERMRSLLAALGDPQDHAPALHVVGTNGKSSTTRLAAAVLRAGEGRVGAYTSPHVTDWRERIQIDDEPISEERFAAAITEVRAASEALDLPGGDAVTQFEALTAAAFTAFRAADARVMVIEAGLGGRYDATNVLRPGAAVILTNVSLDHTELLGESEAEIAAEKLAVCADGHRRLTVGPCAPVAERAVRAECVRRGLVPEWVGRDIRVDDDPDGGLRVGTPRGEYSGIRLPLAGEFQRGNLAAAIGGAEMVAGGPLDGTAVARAVSNVTMPGRLEWASGAPPVLLDGAHNPAGVSALVAALPEVTGARRPRVGVVSTLGDKDVPAMMAALAPHLDMVVATGSHHARALPAAEVARITRAAGADVVAEPDPGAALALARRLAGPQGVVIVTGSLYLLVDIRPAVIT